MFGMGGPPMSGIGAGYDEWMQTPQMGMGGGGIQDWGGGGGVFNPPVTGTQGSSPFNQQEQMKKMLPMLMMMMGMGQQQARPGAGWEESLVQGLSPLVGQGSFMGMNALLGNPFQSMMGGMMGGGMGGDMGGAAGAGGYGGIPGFSA